MKERERQVLEYIVNSQSASLDLLLSKFHISKRTLYYDIESINYHIKHSGQIKNIGGNFTYIGKDYPLDDLPSYKHSEYARKNNVLYKIIVCGEITIDTLAEDLGFSKNTIVYTLEEVKKDLFDLGLCLKSKPYYHVVGDELKIRNLFLSLMNEDKDLLKKVDQNVLEFDSLYNANLTDYSIASISCFASFIKNRIRKGFFIEEFEFKEEVRRCAYYKGVIKLLPKSPEREQDYLCAYMMSCCGIGDDSIAFAIDKYIDKITYQFALRSALSLENEDSFKHNMQRHLLSSYYRIKYRFPVHNPVLEEIKLKHGTLFKIIKSIIQNEDYLKEFKQMREEEIAFIAAYFGGYIERGVSRILLVCPNGLMVSSVLKIQMYKYIPMINIVDVISLKELPQYKRNYDYIVSTVYLPDFKDAIVVNPLLTKSDIARLMKSITNFSASWAFFDVDSILEIVKKHAYIKDDFKLKKDLLQLFYNILREDEYRPMLKEIITEDRIQTVSSVTDWKEAIKLASAPLLLDKSIEESYIEAMINSVIEHGPYIVIADRFALPHSSARDGVNRLAIALLMVEQDVDLLGKPVKMFAVLATPDKVSHLEALSALTELLYDEKNMDTFMSGDKSAILKIINEKKENV